MATTNSVGIIGTGHVGVAAAYALFQHQSAEELVLVDRDRQRAEGEAMDLMHAQPLIGRVTVRAGDYADLERCSVIVVSAGVSQQPGESRLALLNRNAAVFRDIVAELDRHAPEAVLVIATNPVDVLTYVTQRLSNRPAQRILGTGTMLDTSRFRAALGDYYGINPRSVHAYILGEHGDSEVPIWSATTIGGVHPQREPINGHAFDPAAMAQLFEQVRNAAAELIARKGYTDTAIGLVIAYLVRVILEDQKSVLPVSVDPEGECGIADVCLSLPCVVGRHGVEARVTPELEAQECAQLQASAQVLRDSLAGLEV